MYRRRVALWFLAVLALIPSVAMAHEVGGSRFDSPLPLPLLFAGAGATVAITALWLGWSEPTPDEAWTHRLGVIPGEMARVGRFVAVAVFTVAVLGAIITGALGPQATAENFATVFVWGVWFKGLGLVAMLVGTPWLLLSPWRNVYQLLSRLEGEQLSMTEFSDRFGVWPAVAGFVLVIGLAENLIGVPRSPPLTVGVVVTFALLMIAGGIAFGPVWFRRGDAFAVLYRLFGRVAPIDVKRTAAGGYRLESRPPWRGCTKPLDHPGAVTFVVAVVYTVSFDGFTSTPEYQTVLFTTRDALGTGLTTALFLYAAGLTLFVASFLIVAALADVAGSGDNEARSGATSAARAFAPTVIPIAAAYEFAHYYPSVVRSVGRTLELTIAAAGIFVDISLLGWLGLPIFWGSQVLLIVGGHIVAVVAAHGVAHNRYRTPPNARRGHLPLVVLMIGYTVLSLWIVSRPVVTG